ncbi:VacJ family lipoprotein [Acinetobacter wanghuae]|uniref:VacJ family lipoprotein n=1 Tax=Acinetobacter wanghuae TaxID=2662362 RepID=A0A5Q0NZU6_9GAMM|nr:VacJ family lipoprotein [Acinetobacter wanghuae]MQW90790.1 VacJ family lipoprotein [Acinetobacter wanghuae]QGA10375.1 VacJ family lipoprotein [Acinetobacter wanghuae]
MRPTSYLYISLFSILSASTTFANDNVDRDVHSSTKIKQKISENYQHLKTQINVDANAAQEEEVKDPFQPLNRQVYAFNDVLDRNIARPLAVQYTKKIPSDVRASTRLFRKNLGEPWNAVNQLAQGRFSRAAQTFGRFTINTVTSLGFADPATRLGLSTEDEDFGTTLGYYGIPSGPYVMLPILGPSTFRDSIGRIADSQARPQKYLLDGDDRLYYSEQLLRGVDARSQVLDVEQVLQGDKYAQLRDFYLQRKSYSIAEKKGLEQENLFMDDDFDSEDLTEQESNPSE